MTETVLTNTRLVLEDEVIGGSVALSDGTIRAVDHGPATVPGAVDCEDDLVMPGLVELHTDNLERHIQPRPGVDWPHAAAILAHDRELASCGITTVFDALRVGTLRSSTGMGYEAYARDPAGAGHRRSICAGMGCRKPTLGASVHAVRGVACDPADEQRCREPRDGGGGHGRERRGDTLAGTVQASRRRGDRAARRATRTRRGGRTDGHRSVRGRSSPRPERRTIARRRVARPPARPDPRGVRRPRTPRSRRRPARGG